MSQNFDLASAFQKVTLDLVKNQQSLNQADGYNQNHGDNMVRTFQTITKAVQLKQKQGSPDSAALAYAAKRLTKSSSSASAHLYAQGLSQAAAQFQGKQIDQRSGMQLLQTSDRWRAGCPPRHSVCPGRRLIEQPVGWHGWRR